MSDAPINPKEAKAAAAAEKARAKSLRPWFKKKRFIAPIALVLIIAATTANNAGSGDAKSTTSSTSEEVASTETTESNSATSNETVSQANAREKASDYLDTSAFSRSGLIDQLEFEGFETADATYGVDALTVDWNEQAAKKAADYLDTSSFSRSGLIDQLEFEGFTTEQATYGVSQTGL
jgi:hypothetical protein